MPRPTQPDRPEAWPPRPRRLLCLRPGAGQPGLDPWVCTGRPRRPLSSLCLAGSSLCLDPCVGCPCPRCLLEAPLPDSHAGSRAAPQGPRRTGGPVPAMPTPAAPTTAAAHVQGQAPLGPGGQALEPATSCKETPDFRSSSRGRMCVVRRRPGPRAPWVALYPLGLPLGLLLAAAAATARCPANTYPGRDGQCCNECPPGSGMESRCFGNKDSVCQPCQSGFYNEAYNYVKCKPCTQCNSRTPLPRPRAAPAPSAWPDTLATAPAGRPAAPPAVTWQQPLPVTWAAGSGSETKKHCTPKQDTVCVCKAGTQPQAGYKQGVDCAPCPPGHFSRGDGQACRPWTNCSLEGKRTLQPASSSSDSVCDSAHLPPTPARETPAPPTRPATASPSTAQPGASSEPPRGPELATVLGLGLGLGLLAPTAALLALLLCPRAWRLPASAPKPPGFRTPIQEEHTDTDCPLAKV
ncbi:Tumor necrosis factor receptor superfamily member 4 [Galemys pyrenaicus]|uniref:Tumor necrosis factor receptor superfamily member 4 n=1 Tax=Galemys pyrenaicus TaxID=202257 RepID=A0A8J6DEE4_GALPY|nr:Tumor necrosis factor receptor superfamily member 4 [Galemys pyrenaicus]